MAWTKEYQKEYMKAYRAANKDRIAAQMKITEKVWREANKERISANKKADRIANPEKYAARAKAWKANNRALVNADASHRRAAQLQRTPPWADMAAIAKVYAAAAFIHEELGYDLPHVDHIIPLQGKNVSGLHIASNLQLLSASANTSKGNRHE